MDPSNPSKQSHTLPQGQQFETGSDMFPQFLSGLGLGSVFCCLGIFGSIQALSIDVTKGKLASTSLKQASLIFCIPGICGRSR